MDLPPGTILLGKYRVEELIGTGGMSRVLRVSHLYLQQSVALKVLLPTVAESAGTVQRFLREAQATVKLRSEHIARVSDVGTLADGLPFMEMEYLDGNDLNQILRHHGPQVPAIVCDLMLQACEGLSEAHHMGIIHRDIKPSNFFITRRPDGSMLLKILDFGISKTPVGYTELTGTQTVIGTPTYMAPEQMKSGRSADPRSDIWSLGVVMYQLINGRPPFAGESYAELVLKVGAEPPEPMHVQIPQGLHELIFRCLEKDPNRRHQTVAELARQLAPYATDPHAGAQSASRSARIQMGSRLHNQSMALSSNGGVQAPLSPAQLTPKSWHNASNPSSLSHGRGQMTHQIGPSPKRGLWIAGVAGLCLGTGVGGFFLSRQMGKDDKPTAAKAPEAKAVATPDPPKVAPPTDKPIAAVPTAPPPTAPPPTVPAPTAPTIAATPPTAPPPTVPTIAATPPTVPPSAPTIAPKPTMAPTPKPVAIAPKPPTPKPAVPVAKPVAATPPKPTPKPTTTAAAKPTPKPTTPAKPKHDDELFNSRK